jgi:hypothetical protein
MLSLNEAFGGPEKYSALCLPNSESRLLNPIVKGNVSNGQSYRFVSGKKSAGAIVQKFWIDDFDSEI